MTPSQQAEVVREPTTVAELRAMEPSRIEAARYLQRRGRTFTEIAEQMRVSRQSVVDALYWGIA